MNDNDGDKSYVSIYDVLFKKVNKAGDLMKNSKTEIQKTKTRKIQTHKNLIIRLQRNHIRFYQPTTIE